MTATRSNSFAARTLLPLELSNEVNKKGGVEGSWTCYRYAILSGRDIWISFLIGAVSCIGLSFYEHQLRYTVGDGLFYGFYFQQWHSDEMQQTVNVSVLREKGVVSFWYLHVQPPIYDFIRYVLSFGGPGRSNIAAQTTLDGRIYLLYCFVYGAFNQLIYLGSRALGFRPQVAILFAILWAIYPGNLAIATLLDSTYLSAFLFAWVIFTLYLYLREPSLSRLAFFLIIFLVASWTRTIFQVHFFALLLVVVGLVIFVFHGQNSTKASIVALPLATALFFLPLKQQYLYGTLATTTFAGQHAVEGIWYKPSIDEISSIDVPKRYLENAQQLQNKYNSVEQVVINYRYEKIFYKILMARPALVLDGIQKSLLQGMRHLWSPTQDYVPNKLIQSLPWVRLSRLASNGLSYFSIALLGLVGYLVAIYHGFCDFRLRYMIIFGFIGLAFATIIIGSNRYEWTEAERLKFLIEAPFLLFCLHGIYLLFATSRTIKSIMIKQVKESNQALTANSGAPSDQNAFAR